MVTFNQSLTRIRRFLRDPNDDIWEDEEIRLAFVAASLEVAQKIGYLEIARSYSYPPLYTWSYLFDCEKSFAQGDIYRALSIWPASDAVCCYPWEPGYDLDTMDTVDEGERFTHPWESVYVSTPGDVVEIPLHARFYEALYAAWDEEKVEPSTEKEISMADDFYKTTSGEPENYYIPSEADNQVVLYPRPSSSSVTWDTGSIWTDTPTDSFSDTTDEGNISYSEEGHDDSNLGLIVNTLATAGHFFMVFRSMPADVADSDGQWDREIPSWPAFMIPVIEYGALERLYGSDSEGFIPSLRDYWAVRKKIGIEMIKTFNHNRVIDRDYRMGRRQKTGKPAYPRLPAHYPAI